MKAASIMILASLTGCLSFAKKGVQQTPTNSMCLDSLILNLEYHGCKKVSMDKTVYGYNKIYCTEYENNSKDSEWITNKFYATSYGQRVPDDTKPICGDPFLILSKSEED
tara:strand:- start:2397 stop:2726 length:330 start_codon:yes stop_codon:yes gene_type:complete